MVIAVAAYLCIQRVFDSPFFITGLYINRKRMFIKQLYTACLSEAAYYIESEGEVAIIDPLRDVDMYLQMAKGQPHCQ